MIRRVRKGRQTRADNEAEVVRYAGQLERAFNHWLGSGENIHVLTARLEDLAQPEFPKAYLRGKQQALPKAQLAEDDHQAIAEQLRSNTYYLDFSLGAAIASRRQLAHLLDEDDSKVLDSAFGARVRLQYGGRLWQVIEAGYLAGIRELVQRLRRRTGLPALAMQDDFSDDGEDSEGPSDAELASGLGLSLLGFQRLVDQAAGQSWIFGTEYVTEEDDHVCGPCEDDAGDYWLPDQPPLPGVDCAGSSNCRCHLATIWETG